MPVLFVPSRDKVIIYTVSIITKSLLEDEEEFSTVGVGAL